MLSTSFILALVSSVVSLASDGDKQTPPKIWLPDHSYSDHTIAKMPTCEELLTKGLEEFNSDAEGKKTDQPVLFLLSDLQSLHPELADSELFRTMRWFFQTQNLEDSVLKVHLSDWLKKLSFSESSAIENLRKSWPIFSRAQKMAGINLLLKIIEQSKITSLFDDPMRWASDVSLAESLDFEAEQIQEFNRRWKRMSETERRIFLLVAISDELPKILSTFLPVIIKDNHIILSQIAVNGASKLVSIRLSGNVRYTDLQVDEGIMQVMALAKSLATAAWFGKVLEYIEHAEVISFDDVLYFFSKTPKESFTWMNLEQGFQSLSEEQVKAMSGFAHYGKIEDKQIGRMGTVSDYAMRMLMKLPAPLTPDQYNVGSSRVDLQACKLEYSIVSPK